MFGVCCLLWGCGLSCFFFFFCLVFVNCYMWFIVCRLLFDVCCGVCCLLFAVCVYVCCCLLRDVCCSVFVVCCLLLVVCCLLVVVCCVLVACCLFVVFFSFDV